METRGVLWLIVVYTARDTPGLPARAGGPRPGWPSVPLAALWRPTGERDLRLLNLVLLLWRHTGEREAMRRGPNHGRRDRAAATGEPGPRMRGDVMRKIWAASAAMLVCLALGGLTVSAQDGPAWITGSVSCEVSDWGIDSVDGEDSSIRDRLATCTVTASDPRASGAGLHVYNEDCHSRNCIDWGTYEVVGSDGSWSGPWTGVESPEGILTAYSQQSGTGGHAGWNLVTVTVCDCTTGTITLEGVLYEGPPPPYGLLPLPEGE
jgi:hypothetical protein